MNETAAISNSCRIEMALFNSNWKSYSSLLHSRVYNLGTPLADIWRLHGPTLFNSWKALMQSLLPEKTYRALDLLLDITSAFKAEILLPGGYMFTKAGTRRKRTSRHYPIALARLTRKAAVVHKDAVGEDIDNLVLAVILGSSGTVSVGIAKNPVRKPLRLRIAWPHVWPWPRSLKTRMKRLQTAGILSKPDDNMVWR